MLNNASKCLSKAALKIKLSKCSFFKEQIHYLGQLVSGTYILPLTDKTEALMKLKPPTNIKEVRHFLGLTGYNRKLICNYSDIAHPLNCLTQKSQPFLWTPDFQSSFNMLCSRLANTLIVQLPDPNKPYLLFTDVSMVCYSGMLTQASTSKSNKALIKLLTDSNPLEIVHSQTQDLQLNSNIVHPVAYISDSFTESQCRWLVITKECFSVFMSIKKCSFYLQNSDLLVCSDHELLLKIFTGNTNNEKCTTWGLKATTIPRHVKVHTLRE